MVIIALIPARGGSKGLPRKNILPVGGKPLLAWTIEAALQSPQLQQVIVSTDDPEIAEVAQHYGASVPFMRPPELAQDTTPGIAVIRHALQCSPTPPDCTLLLQPTSPLRTTEDIKQAIELFQTRQARAVVSVCEAEQHPYWMKQVLPDGTLTDFIQRANPITRRQDLPPVYALNGAIYLNRAEDILHGTTVTPPGTLPYIMPPERSLDIDTPWQRHLADLILRERYE